MAESIREGALRKLSPGQAALIAGVEFAELDM